MIGHVTLDRFEAGVRPGGAALYAAVTAHRLGASAGILTRHAREFPLELIPPQIEVVSLPGARTTTFAHAGNSPRGRVLTCDGSAGPIGPADVPGDWRDAPLVLLAPVMNELDPALAAAFPEATICAAAQGWLRARAADGRVVPGRWESAGLVLPRLQTLFLSEEDARPAAPEVDEWPQRIPLGVITAGRRGALLFVNGERYEVPPLPAREVDPTGAGDVFAAAFMFHYDRDGDPWDAAAAASCAAALSVEGEGFTTVPDTACLAVARKRYRQLRDLGS